MSEDEFRINDPTPKRNPKDTERAKLKRANEVEDFFIIKLMTMRKEITTDNIYIMPNLDNYCALMPGIRCENPNCKQCQFVSLFPSKSMKYLAYVMKEIAEKEAHPAETKEQAEIIDGLMDIIKVFVEYGDKSEGCEKDKKEGSR